MIKLESKRLILRPLRMTDVDKIYDLFSDVDVRHYTVLLDKPFSYAGEKRFVKSAIQKTRKGKEYRLAIELKNTGLVGIISLTSVDLDKKSAEIGSWIGKPYWHQHIAQEAAKLILKFGFEKLGLERIEAKVYHPNIASAKLLEKIGFKKEGELRHVIFYKTENVWLNHLVYSILKNEI